MQCAKKIPKTLEEVLLSGCYTTLCKTVCILALFSNTLQQWNNTHLELFSILFGMKLSQQRNVLICLKPVPCPSAMIPENPYDYVSK